ncbi:MAG: hypothetical protein WC788_04380 [Candidatus Paceibacterota bacterium]|jgi:hypothetical protein
MAEKSRIEAQCGACGGSGIYCGFAEPKGVGVVCLECKGSGKIVIEYIPFTERKNRKDIHTVRLSRGKFIFSGVGPAGKEIGYKEFLAGKMPQQ